MLVKNAYFLAYNLKKSHYNKVLPLLYYISGRNYPLFYYKMSRLFAKKLDKRKNVKKSSRLKPL